MLILKKRIEIIEGKGVEIGWGWHRLK